MPNIPIYFTCFCTFIIRRFPIFSFSASLCPMISFPSLSLYIYIERERQRVKTWSKICFCESKLGPGLRQNLVQDLFCLFSPILKCFGGILKTQIVCRGAKIFLAVCQGFKKGFRKKMCTFCFFYVGERKRENMKNLERKKKNRKIVFWGGGCEQKDIFCRNGIKK